MIEKKRLDSLLCERGLVPSRSIAQSLIVRGRVFVNGTSCVKPGTSFPIDSSIELQEEKSRYVSRGGIKLEHALRASGLQVEGKVAIDIGASTGGFTDCLLRHGAVKVYAVDVGRGQLDYTLRNDARVFSFEKTNARYIKEDFFPEKAWIITIDVSFISVDRILPVAVKFLGDGGSFVVLVKPQFEAGRAQVRKGVVRDPEVHRTVLHKALHSSALCGLSCFLITPSPIQGPSGNIEFFLLLQRSGDDDRIWTEDEIDRIVKEAHQSFRNPAPPC